MSVIPLPELISAYLDGEAAPDERRLVEQALVENAELRRLYYEWRMLHTLLTRLPQHRLQRDLSREVLRRAEKLWDRYQRHTHEQADIAPRATRRWWKATAWVTAVAAAALVAVGPWTAPPQQFIAQQPQRLQEAEKLHAAKAKRTENQVAKTQPVTPQPDVAPELKAAPKSTPSAIVASKKALPEPSSPPVMAKSPLVETEAVAGLRGDGAAASGKLLADLATTPASGVTIIRCDVTAESAYGQVLAEKFAEHRIARWDEAAAGRERRRALSRGPNGLAYSNNAAQNNAPQDIAPVAPLAVAADKAFEEGASVRPSDPTSGRQETIAAGKANTEGADRDVEFVYVEASPRQIAALLADFQAQPELFVSMRVVPSSDESLARTKAIRGGSPAQRHRATPTPFGDDVAKKAEGGTRELTAAGAAHGELAKQPAPPTLPGGTAPLKGDLDAGFEFAQPAENSGGSGPPLPTAPRPEAKPGAAGPAGLAVEGIPGNQKVSPPAPAKPAALPDAAESRPTPTDTKDSSGKRYEPAHHAEDFGGPVGDNPVRVLFVFRIVKAAPAEAK